MHVIDISNTDFSSSVLVKGSTLLLLFLYRPSCDMDVPLVLSKAVELAHNVEEAHQVLQKYRKEHVNAVHWTPMHRAVSLGDRVYIKLESEQVTNAFKVRGALNCVEVAVRDGATAVVTASTGNHAMAVAHAAGIMRIGSVIYLPHNVQAAKVRALKRFVTTCVEIRTDGADCLEAERAAMSFADRTGAKYVSPYNDMMVVAGQGTIGVEIAQFLSSCGDLTGSGQNCLYVTVGGGGLISGIASYLKYREAGAWRVVGCQPRKSAVMYESIQAGHVVHCEDQETLSDGSAGDIEEEAITFPLCRDLVDKWILVSEGDIADAIQQTFVNEQKVIEGAAGVAVAGYLHDKVWRDKNECKACVLVACGGNIDAVKFSNIIQAGREAVER